MKTLKSLRAKLFLWYLGSLVLLTIIFFLFVHILAIPYGTDLFFAIFFILTFIGFIIIYKLTSALTYLSSKIKLISRKNLDQRILDIKSEDEIGELAYSFNNLLDRLNGSFIREQQFIADVAHELKTPLSTLRSSLEIARTKKRSGEDYEKVIDEAIRETNYISSTLKNILDLAWSESPSEQKNMTKLNLSELMNELCDIAIKMTDCNKIYVESAIAPDIYILGFKDRLPQAILNIIDNAIKYTNQGTISITLKSVKDKAFILIKDTGLGIKEKDIPHIFDRFYRGNESNKVSGSGLGLAISKSIIALHKGTVEVESFLNRGTTFVIALPLLSS